ncbi:glutamate--cysteine ligase [Nocardioides sp. cx-169]|uniref:carboxylate-amine ligase n=1 Tax=Nocardioides sp. cx-169 TaxID=2899080 RepID=UPI001E57E1B2|nr:glutamate--cysteine ligase [Nocardioides sp. cx-169]MCD4535415.1 glutamate--cysteine ligase [Nocardioides sp. cx-169]
MSPRTVGMEEELLLVDPETRLASPRSQQVIKRFREHGKGQRTLPRAATDELDQELFRHQVETRTDPATDLADTLQQLRLARRTAGEAASDVDLAVVATGVSPTPLTEPQVTRNDRYEDMVQTFGEIARSAGTCGMHVHVAISSDEEGVAVIDRLAPWLPLVLAVSANSPIAHGRDTGYASWRSRMWSSWPSAGVTEAFGDLETYREVSRALIESGAARDPGMLYFDARLAAEHPTVEVRVADVCTDPADGVLVAALVRALVETGARSWSRGEERAPWRAELLRAAHWRAARYGLSGTLMHPVERHLTKAEDVLRDTVDHLSGVLDESGDLDLVREGVDRVLQGGGAARQRTAYERSGSVEGVVDDLVVRTERTWQE